MAYTYLGDIAIRRKIDYWHITWDRATISHSVGCVF